MGIRTRLKSKIKSMLFGSSTATESPRSPSNSFVTPSVSTQVQSEKVQQKTTEVKSQNPANSANKTTTLTVSDQDLNPPKQELPEPNIEKTPKAEVASSKENTEDAPKPKRAKKSTKSKSTEKEAPTPKLPTVDTTGAAFVFEVTSIFPSSCPHCNATSFNNWIRIENKFACGSCNTAY